MKVLGLWSASLVATLAASVSIAQLRPADQVALDQDTRTRYDGDDLVAAFVDSQAELDALEALAVTIWSENTGIGRNVVQLNDGVRFQLAALGIEHNLLHDDVQLLIDAEWAALQNAAQQRGGSWHDTYHQYNDIVTHYNDLAAAYPALTTRQSAGTSLQGRDIPAIRITAPGDASNRPVVFINGGQHAREWISPAVVTYITERLLEDYGSNPRVTELLDSAEVVIVPVANPDGYVYTWTGQRLWRKNRRGSYGVDLNRNWAKGWGGPGSSGNTGSETYRGTAAFSEPETASIRDYILADGSRVIASIDYHSYSQLILWPWGYEYIDPPEPDRSRFESIGQGIRAEILGAGGVPYTPEAAYELYLASGTAQDWCYDATGSLAYTIELRDTGNFGFELPPAQILPTGTENWAGFLYFAEQATTPFTMSVNDGPPATLGAAGPSSLNITIINRASYYLAGTATLHYRADGGPEHSSLLIPLGGGEFRADFPPFNCGTPVSYYFTALADTGETVSLPAEGSDAPYAATALDISVVFADSIETGANGWTVGAPGDNATTGQWEPANPQATPAQPEDDHSNPGTNCWITGAAAGSSIGSFDVDGGSTTLTSPRLDASAAADDGFEAVLTYYRWYSNNQGSEPDHDSMPVEISNNDGVTWTQLELVTENLNRWERKEFNIADFVTPTDAIRVRFVARDLGGGSIVEAGLDDFRLEVQGCACAQADLNCDGTLDFFDVLMFLELFTAQDPTADLNSDGEFNFFDVLAYLELFDNG